MTNFKLNIKGLNETLSRFEKASGGKLTTEVENVTETYTRKMANESAQIAPVLSGQLRNSILASPRKVDGKRGVWQWGSNLDYAQRQEYENASRKGFIRKTVWANRDPYREAIRKRIADGVKK